MKNGVQKTLWRPRRKIWSLVLLFILLSSVAACAIPVRQAFKVDESLPIGRIEGDFFVGQRFPFKIKIPPGWQGDTKYPEFLVEQGYGREGVKETPFFLFNSHTQSSIQFDFSPVGRTVRFSQEFMENLVQMSGKDFVNEVHLEHGEKASMQLSKITPVQLKGVPYAARMSAQFTVQGKPREQGWVYAFAEPYQIFILYLITGQNRDADKEALKQAFSSFEYLGVR
jgi:hypothetical protein